MSVLPALSAPTLFWSLPELPDAEANPLALLQRAFRMRELPFVAVPRCGFPGLLGSVICHGERVILDTDHSGAGWTVHAGPQLIMNGPWLNLNALLDLFSVTEQESCDLLRLSPQALGLLALGLELSGEQGITLQGRRYPLLAGLSNQGVCDHYLLTAQGQVCYALEYQGAWTFNLILATLDLHAQLPPPQGDPPCLDAKSQNFLKKQWPRLTRRPWRSENRPSAAVI